MESLTRPTSRSAVTHRCGICHRPIKPESKSLPVFGRVGPGCRTKHAALVAALKREGLDELFAGPIAFEPVESENADGVSNWEFPPYIIAMRNRAERLGFRFLWHWPHLKGRATCELKLPVNDKRRTALMKKLDRLMAAA